MYQAKVGGKSAAACVLDNDVDTLANNSLKEAPLSTAEEVLWRRRKEIQPWVTNKVLDMCEQKYQSTEAQLEYRKEACSTLEAVAKTQQHMSAVIKDSCGNIQTEITAV